MVDSKIVGSEMDSVEVKNMVDCKVSLMGSGVVGVVDSGVVGVVGGSVVGFRVLGEVMESIVIGIVVSFLTGGKEDT